MKKVFVVFEVVSYEGDFVRGIYLSRQEALVRAKRLSDEGVDPDAYIEVKVLAVGVDLEVE